MKYIVPIHWTMCVDVEVEASDPEEAAEIAAGSNFLAPGFGHYSDDSLVVCEDRIFIVAVEGCEASWGPCGGPGARAPPRRPRAPPRRHHGGYTPRK